MMEPPAKRRRRGSPANREHDDDDNNDELASHPQEISVRRDPDIQLALKRANANHKLQATMAHIIEKYSRDFEGVGDEIDMETGEIIVDNGHISNMRDEGDVGGVWSGNVMGGDDDEEDEGILLEDLPDDYFDDDDDDSGINKPQDLNKMDRLRDCNEPNDPSLSQTIDPQTSRNPTTIPDSQSSSASLPRQSPTPPVPPAVDASHYGFGTGPSSFGPWGMSPAYMMQTWGRDDIPPYIMMPPSQPLPGLEGGRYNFPAQNEYTSIWGRFRSRKTRKAGAMRGVKKSTPSASKSIASVKGNQGHDSSADIPQHNDMEEPPQDEDEVNEEVIDPSGEDNDLDVPGPHPSPPVAEPAEESNQDSTMVDKSERSSNSVLEKTSGNILKKPAAKTGKRPRGRPRLVPVDDQPEPLGEALEQSARGQAQRTSQVLSIELPRIDANIRDQYILVEDIPEIAPEDPESSEPNKAASIIAGKVIPDSQDTATVFNSSAPQVPSQPELHTQQSVKSSRDIHVSLELSDDEAPLLLSKLGPPKRKRSVSQAVNKLPPCVEVIEQESSGDDDADGGLHERQTPIPGSIEAEKESQEMLVEKVVNNDQPGRTKLSNPGLRLDLATEDSTRAPTPAQSQNSKSTGYTALPLDHDQQSIVIQKRGRGRPRSRFPRDAKPDDKTMPSTTSDKLPVRAESPRPRSSSRNRPQPDKQGAHGPAAKSTGRTPRGAPVDNPMDKPADKIADDTTDTSSDKPSHKPLTLSTDPSSTLSHSTEIPSSLSLDDQLPPLPLNPSTTPKRSKIRTARPTGTPSSNPHTPRHTSIRTSRAPSSRRSLLSFVEDDSDPDELVQAAPLGSGSKSARSVTHRIWRSTQLTTEAQRTPSRRHGVDRDASGDTVKTPGGTLRTCGVDGYNCGRDFCFICL